MRNLVYIGEHIVEIMHGYEWFCRAFRSCDIAPDGLRPPDIKLEIREGYGSSFFDYNVSIWEEEGALFYRRADFLMITPPTFKEACLYIQDELALKHALMTLYSSYIVKHGWGLMLHSSCVVEQGKAHLFAGSSGAGKSTVALYSMPRELLADEATLVKVTPEGAIVYNSIFRSELEGRGETMACALASIELLRQSTVNRRIRYRKAEAVVELMDKVFYWSHSPTESSAIFHLLLDLVDQTPVYALHFQKNNTFWELIGS